MRKLILVTLLLALCATAFAKDCRILAGGYEAFLLKAGSANMTLEQRADVVQSRMVQVMSLEQAPAMRLETLKDGSIKIWAGSVGVITVGKRDADAAPGTIKAVAEKWAAGIKNAYTKAAADRQKPAPTKIKLKKKVKRYNLR